jgi:hypothetical protein
MARKRKTNYIPDEESAEFIQDEMDSLARSEKMDWGFILLNQIERVNKCATFIPRGNVFEQQYIYAVKQFYDLMFADFTPDFKKQMKQLNTRYVNQYSAIQQNTRNQADASRFYYDLNVSNYRYYMQVFRFLMQLASRKGLMGALSR